MKAETTNNLITTILSLIGFIIIVSFIIYTGNDEESHITKQEQEILNAKSNEQAVVLIFKNNIKNLFPEKNINGDYYVRRLNVSKAASGNLYADIAINPGHSGNVVNDHNQVKLDIAKIFKYAVTTHSNISLVSVTSQFPIVNNDNIIEFKTLHIAQMKQGDMQNIDWHLDEKKIAFEVLPQHYSTIIDYMEMYYDK